MMSKPTSKEGCHSPTPLNGVVNLSTSLLHPKKVALRKSTPQMGIH